MEEVRGISKMGLRAFIAKYGSSEVKHQQNHEERSEQTNIERIQFAEAVPQIILSVMEAVFVNFLKISDYTPLLEYCHSFGNK
jgi:hypothetical protein